MTCPRLPEPALGQVIIATIDDLHTGIAETRLPDDLGCAVG
jgi:hypothetical protein